jgi:hypothetical protein
VAIVSRSLAKRLFPRGSALGQHLRVGSRDHQQRLEVVGIASDTRPYDRKNADPLAVYVASLQGGELATYKSIVIRADRLSIEDARAAIDGLGREYVKRLDTLPSLASHAMLRERLIARLASYCGGLTMLLACIGLYGLISYGVRQRRREIAIRMALGANPGNIIRTVLSSGLAITLAGAAVGRARDVQPPPIVPVRCFGVRSADVDSSAFAPDRGDHCGLPAAGGACVAGRADVSPAHGLSLICARPAEPVDNGRVAVQLTHSEFAGM